MIYGEESIPIPVGKGIDSYNHPANLQDGYCPIVTNFIAKGDRLVTRRGFIPPLSIDTRSTYVETGHKVWYSRLPDVEEETWPVAIWGVENDTWMIRQFKRDGPGTTSGDTSIVKFAGINQFRGACTYLDKIYILDNSGLNSDTAWNWGAGTVTETLIESDLAGKRGLFVFKDRMWCWDDNKIYYTDAPTGPGAYPETWDVNGKFIHIGAGTGLGKIHNIIPIGTKLFVFTNTGFYNVSVLGSPINWVVRLVDATVAVNHQNCCYENKGIIYFVDTRGVWVTNQDEVKLISEPIQDIFNFGILEETYYEWKLVPFDDGILVCRTKTQLDGAYPSGTQKTVSEAKLMYTKLDDIYWTEFTFAQSGMQPADVIAGFSNMEMAHVWGKANYLVLAHGNVHDPAFGTNTVECLIYTGYQDTLRAVGGSPETDDVLAYYLTKTVRGKMLDEKRSLLGYINFSVGDSGDVGQAVNIFYNWLTESDNTRGNETITPSVVDWHEGLIRIQGPEFFRNVRFELEITLSNQIQEYTILGSAIDVQSHRKTGREIS